MLKDNLILVGYSGHGFVITEAATAAGYAIQYYVDIKESILNPFNLKYLGSENDLAFKGWGMKSDFIVGIGDNSTREKVSNHILSNGRDVINIIHPSASIAQKVEMAKGNFVARQVAISPLVTIGEGCILNTACIVEHECTIADYVHIAPGAVLAGNVSVGKRTFIGANAVVKQGVTIGADVIIGAGTVVLKDIEDNKKVVGNPNRYI